MLLPYSSNITCVSVRSRSIYKHIDIDITDQCASVLSPDYAGFLLFNKVSGCHQLLYFAACFPTTNYCCLKK